MTDCIPSTFESASRAADGTNDLSDQPCRLSLAKNKDAVLRVGMYLLIYLDECIANGYDIFSAYSNSYLSG